MNFTSLSVIIYVNYVYRQGDCFSMDQEKIHYDIRRHSYTRKLKIQAVKEETDVSKILEKLIKEYLEK